MKDANAEHPTIEKSGEQEFPGGISGFAWEADATARCIRDGQVECDRMRMSEERSRSPAPKTSGTDAVWAPFLLGTAWRESVLQMEIFDKIREQNNFKYPDNIEGTPAA